MYKNSIFNLYNLKHIIIREQKHTSGKMEDPFSFITRHINRLIQNTDNKVLGFFYRQGRILITAFKGFAEDKISLRAAALSFFTLLSIVPLLAMVFGISQGFGLSDYLKDTLREQFPENNEVLDYLLGFVDKYLGRFDGGFITIVGVVVLFWSVMQVLSNIESSFNNIWRIRKSRMFTQKFTDYIAIIVIAPVLLVVTSSFTVSLLPSISSGIPFLERFDIVLKVLATTLSYTLIWFVFTFIFIIVPNTKVKFVPALIAGIISGTLFQLLQWGYVTFQSFLTSYSAVYGTFAALPLFMMWLEMSWLIVLFGAEVAFAYQNRQNYEQEAEGINVSTKQKRLISLLVARSIVTNFVDGKQPLKAVEIATSYSIPVRLVREAIYDLQECGIINEIIASNIQDVAYQPALDPARITTGYVFEKLDLMGHHSGITPVTEDMKSISHIVDSFYEELNRLSGNKLLKDI